MCDMLTSNHTVVYCQDVESFILFPDILDSNDGSYRQIKSI
jgi:hypothetical protein